jgi:hypothetical protein
LILAKLLIPEYTVSSEMGTTAPTSSVTQCAAVMIQRVLMNDPPQM